MLIFREQRLRVAAIATVAAALVWSPAMAQRELAETDVHVLERFHEAARSVSENPDWEARRVPNPGAPGDFFLVYRADEVKADLAAAESALYDAVGDNRVLRAYVSNALPSGAGLSSGSVVRQEEAKRAWARVVRVARAFGSLSSLSLDLEVISLPREGAVVKLVAVGLEDEIRETRTTGTLSRVWRGLYSYQVKMEGILKWQGRLDLVQERGSRLVCSETSGEEAVPCRLE